MPSPLDCPWTACWKALLGDTLPPDQREPYERHLESCPVCQGCLDQSEECRDALLQLARRTGDPTLAPTDATLIQVLDRLQEVKPADRPVPAGPPDLYFLAPAGRPGVLGMLGEYEVQEVIGQGGMGVVLKAYEPALHRLVAVKVLGAAVAGSAVARKRFAREARAAAAVCHDHIVAVHGVHEADGLPYLVMQYVAGESLQDRLDRSGPLEVEEIVRIGLQTARGLAAAHAQGLIHRDIKPANLLLSEAAAPHRTDGTKGAHGPHPSHKFMVKITDFGLARMVDDVGLTQNGVAAGTPEYMAPEQARGEIIDHRADLFSLGSVLYAMCTGASPFRGSTAVSVLRQVSDQTPAPVREFNPDAPAWLEAIIDRLMAKNPADRFQSAAEVASLLEGCLMHLRQPTTVRARNLLSCSSGTLSTDRRPGRGPSSGPYRRSGLRSCASWLLWECVYHCYSSRITSRRTLQGRTARSRGSRTTFILTCEPASTAIPPSASLAPTRNTGRKRTRWACASRCLKGDRTPTVSAWNCRTAFAAILTSFWASSCWPSALPYRNTERA